MIMNEKHGEFVRLLTKLSSAFQPGIGILQGESFFIYCCGTLGCLSTKSQEVMWIFVIRLCSDKT